MKRQIKCILALLLIFAVMVMPAFAATGEEGVKVVDGNGNEKTGSVKHVYDKKDSDEYEDINDFFESASNEDSDAAVDELFPSMGQGVGAVKQVKPIWNPAKFTTWFVIGLAVIIGVLTFAGHFLKANIGSVADKVKWVIAGQKGMFISGLLLLVFIIYLSVIKFIAHF